MIPKKRSLNLMIGFLCSGHLKGSTESGSGGRGITAQACTLSCIAYILKIICFVQVFAFIARQYVFVFLFNYAKEYAKKYIEKYQSVNYSP